MTLVEVMVAVGILALTTVGGISAFTLLNNYAASNRNLTSAKELCQERIEQALGMGFQPPAILPQVNGYYILGQASNWSRSNNLATGPTSEVTTSTENNVNVYLQQDGQTVLVPGTRTTSIVCPNAAQTDVAQFTVKVNYTYRGKPFTYQMTTLRTSD